ncbi:DUF3152 domain-containing protein [Streptomyces sp. NPDC058171]
MGRHSRKGPAAKKGDAAPRAAAPRSAEPPAPAREPRAGQPRIPQPPRYTEGTPARGVPLVRGGHPEQREAGGGWGAVPGAAASGHAPPAPGRHQVPGPRQDYVDAFGDDGTDDVFTAGSHGPPPGAAGPRTVLPGPYRSGPYGTGSATPGAPSAGPPCAPADPYASVTRWDDVGLADSLDPTASAAAEEAAHRADPRQPAAGRARRRAAVPPPRGPGDERGHDPAGPAGPAGRGGKSRTFTGITAAAVTTVLAVVVAGQVAERDGDTTGHTRAAEEADRQRDDPPSRSDSRPTPSDKPAVAKPPTYAEQMGRTYPLDPKLKATGEFDAVPGFVKAPGKGQRFRYRVDVERGLGLDGRLFADAIHKTLNDERSWAHGGARTFERVSSGDADFVITLASPGTTGAWCAKSGLNTTIDNVSCDSASTERVMINAYRWAQGSETYGKRIHAYRQMLINHEVGHRLGFGHVSCQTDGELAPVMQQQTKFLAHDGISCRANPWAYPES